MATDAGYLQPSAGSSAPAAPVQQVDKATQPKQAGPAVQPKLKKIGNGKYATSR